MNYNVPLLWKKSMRSGIWVAVVLFLRPNNAVFTQASAVFEAKVESPEVVQGNRFEVTFTLKDAEGTRFIAPAFGEFKLLDGPSLMRGMTIVNGKASTNQSWTYELETVKTGTFTIGPANVQADGRILRTHPLQIRVVPPRSGNQRPNLPPGANDDLFIQGELDRETAYPGQQVTWRVKLFTLLSIDGADLIALPDFQGFYAKEKRRFDTRTQYQIIRGKKYAVKILHEQALFPQEKGEIVIGPAKVRAGIATPGAFGSFLGGQPVLLQTQPVRLIVNALPEPTPDNFTGGVGQYDWEWQQDKDSLSTDDAATLTVTLRGNGDSRQFSAPILVVPEGLEVFEPRIKAEEEYENGEQMVHDKTLEYVVLPKEPGDYSIQPELVFFDPDSNRYRVQRLTKPILLHVTAGKNYVNNQIANNAPTPEAPVASSNHRVWERFGGWPILLGITTLLLLLVSFFIFRKKRPSAPQAAPAVKQQDAGKLTRERFTHVRHLLGGPPRAFYDALFKSLQAYLSARLGLTPAQLTPAMVSAKLAERKVSSDRIQTLHSVWQTCEQALFAGQTQAAEMEATLRQAEEIVQGLERELKG